MTVLKNIKFPFRILCLVIFSYSPLIGQTFYYGLQRGFPNSLLSSSSTSTISTLSDENYAGPYSIGFNFNFYGTNVSSFILGSNGVLSFSNGKVGTFGSALPNTTSQGLLCFANANLDCSVGSPTINYFTTGTSPNRILVINFINVALKYNTSQLTSCQIQLFEASGSIEIHNISNTSGGYSRTVGTQKNSSNSDYTTTSSLNGSTSVSLINEMVRFTPCSTSIPPYITSSSYVVCNATPNVNLTINNCSGSTIWSTGAIGNSATVTPNLNQDINLYTASCSLTNGCSYTTAEKSIFSLKPLTLNYSGSLDICNNLPLIANSNTLFDGTVKWYKNNIEISGATGYNKNYLTANQTGNYKATLNFPNGCSTTSQNLTITITGQPPVPPTITQNKTYFVAGCADTLIASNCLGTIHWSNNKIGAKIKVSSDSSYSATCDFGGCVSSQSKYIRYLPMTYLQPFSRMYIISDGQELPNNYGISTPSFCNDIYLVQKSEFPTGAVLNWYKNGVSSPTAANTSTFKTSGDGTYLSKITYEGCTWSEGISVDITAEPPPAIQTCEKTTTNRPSKQWDIKLGSFSVDTPSDILPLANAFMIGGTSSSGSGGEKASYNRGYNDYWLVKTTKSGALIWEKSFGSSANDNLAKVIQRSPNEYFLLGTSFGGIGYEKSQASKGSADIWIIKTDSLGNKIWDKSYGTTSADYLESAIISSDGDLLLLGYTSAGITGDKTSANNGGVDFWLIKIDANGNILWDKGFGGSGDDYPKKIVQANNGGYILSGYSNSPLSGTKSQNSQGLNDFWLIKIDENGNVLADKTLGGNKNDQLYQITNFADGYIIGGISSSDVSGDKSQSAYYANTEDYWVLKINNSLSKVWDKRLGSNSGDFLKDIVVMPDSNILLVGYTQSTLLSGDRTENTYGYNDYWLVNVDKNGNKLWDEVIGTSKEEGSKINFIIHQGEGYLLGSSNGSDIDKSSTSTGNSEDIWLSKWLFCSAINTPISTEANQPITIEVTNCSSGQIIWNDGTSGHTKIILPTTSQSYIAQCVKNGCISETSDPIIVNVMNSAPCPTFTTVPNINFSSSFLTIYGNISSFCSEIPLTATASPNSSNINFKWYKNEQLIGSTNTITTQNSGTYTLKTFIGNCQVKTDSFYFKIDTLFKGSQPTIYRTQPTQTDTLNYVWDMTYPRKGSEEVNSAVISDDNHLLVLTYQPGLFYPKLFLTKITRNGQVRWQRPVDLGSLTQNTLINSHRPNRLIISQSPFLNHWIISETDSIGNYIIRREFQGTTSSQAGDTQVSKIVKTVDGGYLAIGYSNDDAGNQKSENSKGKEDMWVIKLDADLNRQWDKTFGGSDDEHAHDVAFSPDGGYVVAGYTVSPISGDVTNPPIGTSNFDGWLVKINANGTKEWAKRYGIPNEFTGFCNILRVSDGYILLGTPFARELTLFDTKIWLLKLDFNGNKVWERVFNNYNSTFVSNIYEKPNGNLLLVGNIDRGVTGKEEDYWIAETDPTGIVIKEQLFKSANGSDKAIVALPDSDGGLFIVGHSTGAKGNQKSQDSYTNWTNNIWLIKTAPYKTIANTGVPQNTPIQLMAVGCHGDVHWSSGQTGNPITITPLVTQNYTAYCSDSTYPCQNALISNQYTLTVTVPCLSSHQLVGSISGNEQFHASNTIQSTSQIIPQASIEYEAGKSILLLPGFEAKSTTVFKASIKSCN